MKVLALIVISVGVVAIVGGLLIATGSDTSDPGQLRAATVLGLGIGVTVAGGTLVAIVVGIAAWFAPILRAQGQLRRRTGNNGARVVQRTSSLKAALELATGRPVEVPAYMVVTRSDDGIGFWNSAPAQIAAISSGDIQSVEIGQAITTRPVPSVVIKVNSVGSRSLISLEFVPSRVGLELFPVLDREITSDYARDLRDATITS